jgi:hypothetical protein
MVAAGTAAALTEQHVWPSLTSLRTTPVSSPAVSLPEESPPEEEEEELIESGRSWDFLDAPAESWSDLTLARGPADSLADWYRMPARSSTGPDFQITGVVGSGDHRIVLLENSEGESFEWDFETFALFFAHALEVLLAEHGMPPLSD